MPLLYGFQRFRLQLPLSDAIIFTPPAAAILFSAADVFRVILSVMPLPCCFRYIFAAFRDAIRHFSRPPLFSLSRFSLISSPSICLRFHTLSISAGYAFDFHASLLFHFERFRDAAAICARQSEAPPSHVMRVCRRCARCADAPTARLISCSPMLPPLCHISAPLPIFAIWRISHHCTLHVSSRHAEG